MKITARQMGREGEPLVCIDGFAPDPDALRAAAAVAPFAPAGQHYPGIRAPLPPDYITTQRAVLATVLREAFGCSEAMRVLDGGFAMVTTPPAELTPEQRLPHVDATAPDRIAVIHHLSADARDGTAFFRHRSTGFETVSDARAATYFARLQEDVARAPPPPAYIAGDTPLFEVTHLAAPADNRAYVYRSRLLHSGAIGEDAVLSADPAQGRLTITLFLSAR